MLTAAQHRHLGGLLVALSLAVAACATGDTSGSDGPAVTPDPTAAVATPDPTPPDPPDPTATTSDLPTPTPTPSRTPSSAASPAPTPTPKPLPDPITRTGIDPVRIEIPEIGVDARIVDLAIGPGDPEVPEGWEDAGWYRATRNPGEIGPAVIAGHIDSKAGPAVFFRLDELSDGDEIIVHDDTGDSRTYVVEGSGQYPKEALPDEVFGFGDRRPELRVITCGGSFDRSVGHYRDNLVVYAAMAN